MAPQIEIPNLSALVLEGFPTGAFRPLGGNAPGDTSGPGADLVQLRSSMRFDVRFGAGGLTCDNVPHEEHPGDCARATLRRAAGDRYVLCDGYIQVRLDAAGAAQLQGYDSEDSLIGNLTAEGLVVPLPAERLIALPRNMTRDTLLLPVALRFAGGAWSYRPLPAWPGEWADKKLKGLQEALHELADALVASTPALTACAIPVHDTPFQPLDPKLLATPVGWPWSATLASGAVTLSGTVVDAEGRAQGQALALAPRLLRASQAVDASGTAHAVYSFVEGNPPEQVPPDLWLTVRTTHPGASDQGIVASMGLPNGIAMEVVLADPADAPDVGLRLWMRTTGGWLSLRAPSDGASRGWGRAAVLSETREVAIDAWLSPARERGLGVELLLDSTVRDGAATLDLGFTVGWPDFIDPMLEVHRPALRLRTGHHTCTGPGQARADLPPFFDDLTRPADAPGSDLRVFDAGGRHLDRLVLLAPRLCEHLPGERGLTATLRYDEDDPAAPPFSLDFDLAPGSEVLHFRQFPALPLATPLAWAANDPDAGRQPSVLRGLVPVRLDGLDHLVVHPDQGPFVLREEEAIHLGSRALWDPELGRPWRPFPGSGLARELWPLRREHLGTELSPDDTTGPGTAVRAGATARYALPLLDNAYRTALPRGLVETARAGLEQVDQARVPGPAVSIPDLDKCATGTEDVLTALCAKRDRPLPVSPPVMKEHAVMLRLSVASAAAAPLPLPLRLAVWLASAGSSEVRRWTLLPAPDPRSPGYGNLVPTLGGLELTPIALEGPGEGAHPRYTLRAVPMVAVSGLAELSLTVDGTSGALSAVGGSLAFSAAQVRSLLQPTSEPGAPGYVNHPVSSIVSSSIGYEGVNGHFTLVARDLTCYVVLGTQSFVVRTGQALAIWDKTDGWASAAAELRPAAAGAATEGQLVFKDGELWLQMTHPLPGRLELRERLAKDGQLLDLVAVTSQARASSISARAEIEKVGPRVYLTWAGDGSEVRYDAAEPARVVPELPAEVTALTRCFVRLEREGARYRWESGILGWLGGALFGAKPEAPESAPLGLPHVTLTRFDGAGGTPGGTLALNGLWQAERELQATGIEGASAVVHTVELALWDVTLPVDFPADAPGGAPRVTGTRLDVVACHTLRPKKADGVTAAWCALVTARWDGARSLDLSGTFELVPYPAGTPAVAIHHRRPGMIFTEAAPPAPEQMGNDWAPSVCLIALPCVLGGEAAAPPLEVLQNERVEPPARVDAADVARRPWAGGLPAAPQDAASVPLPHGKGTVLGQLFQLPSDTLWACYTLFALPEGPVPARWIPSRLNGVALDTAGGAESRTPSAVVWALGAGGDFSLYRLATIDVAAVPAAGWHDVAELEARQILAGARWHDVAVLESRVDGKVTWERIQSPLLEREPSLDPLTGALMPGGPGVPSPIDRRLVTRTSSCKYQLAPRQPDVDIQSVEAPSAPGAYVPAPPWVPPHLWLHAVYDDGRRAAGAQERPSSADFFLLTLDRAVPFAADRAGEGPVDPFAVAAPPFDVLQRDWSPEPGWLSAGGSALRLGVYAPRPGELTGYGLSATLTRSACVDTSPVVTLVVPTPRAFDDQEVVSIERYAVEDVIARDDGMHAVRVQVARRHPETILLVPPSAVGDGAGPIAVTLGSPGVARAGLHDAMALHVFVLADALSWLGPGAVVRLTLTQSPSTTEPGLVTVTVAGQTPMTAGSSIEVPVHTVGSPGAAVRDVVVTLVFEKDAAIGAWTVSLHVRDPAGKVTPRPDLMANRERVLLVGKDAFEPPAPLLGVLRTGAGTGDRRVVAYGEDRTRWQPQASQQSPPAGPWVIGWRKLGVVVDRLPRRVDVEAVRYEVIAVASDGSVTTGTTSAS